MGVYDADDDQAFRRQRREVWMLRLSLPPVLRNRWQASLQHEHTAVGGPAGYDDMTRSTCLHAGSVGGAGRCRCSDFVLVFLWECTSRLAEQGICGGRTVCVWRNFCV